MPAYLSAGEKTPTLDEVAYLAAIWIARIPSETIDKLIIAIGEPPLEELWAALAAARSQSDKPMRTVVGLETDRKLIIEPEKQASTEWRPTDLDDPQAQDMNAAEAYAAKPNPECEDLDGWQDPAQKP